MHSISNYAIILNVFSLNTNMFLERDKLGDFSLLWPGGKSRDNTDFSGCTDDLDLGRLCSILFTSMPMAEGLKYADSLLTGDREVLTARHEIIDDLIANEALIDAFEEVSALVEDMKFFSDGVRDNIKGLTGGDVIFDSMKGFIDNLEKLLRKDAGSVFDEQETNNHYAQMLRATIFTYENIKAYHKALSILKDALGSNPHSSKGLAELQQWVETIWKADKLDDTGKKLAEIAGWWTGISSFAVDIAISPNMDLQSFEISEINSRLYSKTGMLDRGAEDGYDGLTLLYSMPQGGTTVPYQEYLLSELGLSAKAELTKLRSAVVNLPFTGRLQMISLGSELPFLTSAARLCLRGKEKGLPFCRPEFSDDAIIDAEGVYMTELALLGSKAVANDMYLGENGAANIITGANSSGKTTYIITAGQLMWLFQLGCHLPAVRARLKPVDALFTLFAAGESDTSEDSRMGLEVIRIGEFKRKMTNRSVVLLNEPMTSTSAAEGIEICLDLICDMMKAGVSSMMVTHYNEIYAMSLERLAGTSMADKVESYVMAIEQTPDGINYTYNLVKSPPGKSSYAYAVVSKLGVTLEAMLARMQSDGIDVKPDSPVWQQLHPEDV